MKLICAVSLVPFGSMVTIPGDNREFSVLNVSGATYTDPNLGKVTPKGRVVGLYHHNSEFRYLVDGTFEVEVHDHTDICEIMAKFGGPKE